MVPTASTRVVRALTAVVAATVIAAACGSSDDDGDASPTSATEPAGEAIEAAPVDASLFDDGALVGDVETVDCTLENGSGSSCYQLTVGSQPATVEAGPFCPSTVDDPDHGIFVWDGDEPGLYALDEPFWAMLADQGYAFAGEDGTVNVADPGDAGAQPPAGDVCLQATPDDSYTLQVLIPIEPERLDEPTDLGTVSQVGVATDGVTIFGDAPSGTTGAIPALDRCGGHDDPSGYYHWHFGSTSVQTNLDEAGIDLTCGQPQDAEALVGLAYDGHPIYGPLEDGAEPTDLDECNGHEAPTDEFGAAYHYHLSFDSPNLPGCRVGAAADGKLSSPDNPAVQLPDTGGAPGAGGPPPGGPPPGGAAAAVDVGLVTTGGHCHTHDGDGAPICH